VSVLVCLSPELGELHAEGSLEGEIAPSRRGEAGFGYDPIFIPAGYGATVAELGERWKERNSHRALAARALEAAVSDDDAHRLWHAAFGLSPARHLGIVLDDDTVPATASWWENRSAVAVSRQLRASGHTDYVRKARQVADRSAAKQALAASARAAQQQAAQAASALTRLGVVSISEINVRVDGPVDPVMLRLLASLLYRALRGHRRRDGTRHAMSVDGTMQIDVAEPLPLRAARLDATTGTWTLPDYRICVEWRENAQTAERAAAEASPHATPGQALRAQQETLL